jgi:UrcA family protein
MFLRIASRLAAAAFLAATVPATYATAQPGGGTYAEYSVSTDGLDMATGAGRAALERRLRIAALHVCAEVTGGRSMADDSLRDCFRTSLAGGEAASRPLIARAQARLSVASRQQ